MKIKVLQNYGGVRTNEQRILPGVYDVNDNRLFGLANFLLETKRAIVVNDETQMNILEHIHDESDGEPLSTISHDEIMRRKGRPISSPVDDIINQLRGEYEYLADEEADGRWGINTLKAKIAEFQDDPL